MPDQLQLCVIPIYIYTMMYTQIYLPDVSIKLSRNMLIAINTKGKYSRDVILKVIVFTCARA